MKYFLILLLAVFLFLGLYSSWYAANHASIHIGFKFNDNEKDLMKVKLHKARVKLLNDRSEVLADGIYNGNYSLLHLLNPQVKNVKKCLDLFGESHISNSNLYNYCFNYSKSWAAEWIDELKYIQIEHPDCLSLEIPLTIGVSSGGFFGTFFWWFPMPHGGSGPPSDSYFSTYPKIDKSDCAILTEESKKKSKGVGKVVLKELTKKEKARLVLASRFKGKLSFEGEQVSKDWDVGVIEGKNVWLEKEYGLLWGERLSETIDSWGSKQDRQKAEKLCGQEKPIGYWGLPTQAEYVLSKKNGMGQVVEDLDGKWLSQIVTQYDSNISGAPITFKYTRASKSSIRCVAITEKSPSHGYFSGDFPLNFISSIIMDDMAESGRRYRDSKK